MGVRVYKGGSGGGSGSQGPAGPAGLPVIWFEDGEQGDQGVPGPTGVAGAAGASGAPGAQGVVGMPGPPGFDGSDPEEPLLMAGPMGPQGVSGASGASGAAGAQGPIGLMGPPGFDGSDPDEPMLVMGPAGAAGTGGAAATAISGIAGSNTTYTSGTVTLTGVGGGITVSSNTGQRIDLSVAAPVAQTAQTANLHNVTLSGNTAGAMAHISSGTMTLAGGNNIVMSQAGNAVTISGSAFPAAQTFVGGIAGSNTTYTSGTALFSGVGGGVTVSSNTGQRIDISVAPAGAGANQSYWHNHTGHSMSNVVPMTNSTSAIAPFLLPYPMSASYLRIPVSIGTGTGATMATSNGATGSASIMSTYDVQIYSRGTGASSLSLQRAAYSSVGFTQRWSISAAAATGSNYSISYQFSYPVTGGTSSYSSTVATLLTNLNASLNSTRWSWDRFSGNRVVDIPFATTLSEGPWWIMTGVSSSTASAGSYSLMTNNRLSAAHVYMHPQSALTMGRLGEVTAGSFQMVPGIGSFSTAAGATTASLGFSNISSSAGHPVMAFGLHNSSGA